MEMVLKLWQVSESSGRLIKTVLTGPTPRIAGSVGEGAMDLRIGISQILKWCCYGWSGYHLLRTDGGQAGILEAGTPKGLVVWERLHLWNWIAWLICMQKAGPTRLYWDKNPQAWFCWTDRGEASDLESPGWDELPRFPVSPLPPFPGAGSGAGTPVYPA